MQKKLTILFAFAIFVLVVGWAITPAQAHCTSDDNHNNVFHKKNPCKDGDGGDTTSGKKSIALKMTFDDMDGDNLQSDWTNLDLDCLQGVCPYVDEEGAGVGASERSQPNPAAGIGLGLNRKNGEGRQLDLNITCEKIHVDGLDIDNCTQLPVLPDLSGVHGLLGFFPDCDKGTCNLGTGVRPYKVNCPVGAEPCPDVFTMPVSDPVLMSYRLSLDGGGVFIEVASAIGGGGGLDPGRCLSLLDEDQQNAFLTNECTIVSGDIVTNVDNDETEGEITVVSATTITTDPLPGGMDIVWDFGDGYKIRDGVTDALIASGTHTGSSDSPLLVDSNSDFTVVRCNVTVTALDDGSAVVGSIANDGETDAWRIDANGAKALICSNGNPKPEMIGQTTLTFGFDAVKK